MCLLCPQDKYFAKSHPEKIARKQFENWDNALPRNLKLLEDAL